MQKDLENKIQETYESGVTVDQAEKLAAEFLHASLIINSHLATLSLDARMKKSGLKAIRAAVYLEEVSKSEKKPTEAMLSAILDTNELVSGEQTALDTSEVEVEELKRLYDTYNNCHIYYRNIGKNNG